MGGFLSRVISLHEGVEPLHLHNCTHQTHVNSRQKLFNNIAIAAAGLILKAAPCAAPSPPLQGNYRWRSKRGGCVERAEMLLFFPSSLVSEGPTSMAWPYPKVATAWPIADAREPRKPRMENVDMFLFVQRC